MARNQVGSFCKNKDPNKPPYIKMRDGKIYRVESAKFQLQSLEKAVTDGKLTEEVAVKVRDRISKMPDWVLGEVVEFTDEKKVY
jgi:hypothetical protein